MKKHKAKLKLARKMLTREELKSNTPVFESKAWLERKEQIKKRVIEDEAKAKKAKEEEG